MSSNPARSPAPMNSPFTGIAVLSQMTFLNALRERFYRGLFFLLIFFLVLAYYLTVLTLAEPQRIFVEVGYFSILLTGVLIVFYFGIFELKRQEEARGIHILLAKPIPRGIYLFGHLAGVTGVLWVYTGIASAFLVVIYRVLFGEWLAGGLGAFLVVSFELTILNVLALFSSVLFSSTIVSLFGFLSLFVIGHTLAEARSIVMSGARPATQWITQIIYYAFPSFQHFSFAPLVIYKESYSPAMWAMITGYGLVYAGVFLLLSLVLFNRKEIE